MRKFLTMPALCTSLSVASLPNAFAADTSQSLFNGKNLAGWDTWLGAPEVPAIPVKLWGNWPEQIGLNQDEAGVFTVVSEDGEPAIRISGEIWGALISESEFSNYHLTLEYKWGNARFEPRANKPRNSGLLYHSTGEYGAFWSYWMRSVEFEIMQGATGDFTSVDGIAGEIPTEWDWDAPFPWQRYSPGGESRHVGGLLFRVFSAEDVERPRGEWNRLDLYAHGDTAVHNVNGHTVLKITALSHEVAGKAATLQRGKLQLQSEGAEIFFRDIRISGIGSLPANQHLPGHGQSSD